MTHLSEVDINHLIFVDTNIKDYQSLIPDTSNSEAILLDSQANGIEQISTALEQYDNLDSISIFSHGETGLVQLGNSYLSNDNLDSYEGDLTSWGEALSESGDLLFYGCNVAASNDGFDFVERVAAITNADVAASDDLTGNSTLGGDWTLEVTTGDIETSTFRLTEYGNLLDLQFQITYDMGVNTATKTAFEFAGKMLGNVLSDDATINIHVTQASNNDLPDNILAGAVPAFVQGTSYSTVRNRLASDRTTSDDFTAVNSLETGSTWRTNEYGTTQNFSKVALTRANAKALNLINRHSNELDGIITVNNLSGTGFGWEHDYTRGVGSNEFDMATVAMHEIIHVLGFVSAVDALDTFVDGTYSEGTTAISDAATSLDLFRYQGSNRFLQMGQAGFSIDGGINYLTQMSEGTMVVLGDGYQGSHFKNEYNAGVMDPVADLGSRRNMTDLDLQALDVIGWNKISSTRSAITLYNQGKSIAQNKGNINRNAEIDTMLSDWRWARRGSRNTLRQSGNITQFLAQEGFFNVGAFRNSFDFSSVDSTENTTTNSDEKDIIFEQLSSTVNRFGIDVLDVIEDRLNYNSDRFDIKLGQNSEEATVNNNHLVSTVDEWLSSYELDGMSLYKLDDLLQQPELIKSLVADLY